MYQRVESTRRLIDARFLKGHYFWGIGNMFAEKIKFFGEVKDVHQALGIALILAQFGYDTMDNIFYHFNEIVLGGCSYVQTCAQTHTMPIQHQAFKNYNV